MKAIEVVVLALATWRISSLLGQEDGPFEVLGKLRYRLGERYDDHSNPIVERLGQKWYHRLIYEFVDQLTCLWCCTLWVGLSVTVLYLVFPTVTVYLALPFALSAVGVYLNTRGGRFRKRIRGE